MLGNAGGGAGGGAGISAVGVWRCNNRPPPAARRGGVQRPADGAGGRWYALTSMTVWG
jgi:hypothetical protein